MRFISHLDMQRLFRRVLYRADVPLRFSEGFNPHPITNIVQPLSLGFEAECDYFEFETTEDIFESSTIDSLNEALPNGIKFLGIREIEHERKNLSSVCEYSFYKVYIPMLQFSQEDVDSFLKQDKITVLKRDKKTKTMVEKDIKNWIYSMSNTISALDGTILDMVLRAAPNETVNPLQLAISLLNYLSLSCASEDIRVTRMDLLYTNDEGILESLFYR